jgi:hypothetical protein
MHHGPVSYAGAKKPAGRDIMHTLIFGAGTLFGVFWGIVLVSLLNMAQKDNAL